MARQSSTLLANPSSPLDTQGCTTPELHHVERDRFGICTQSTQIQVDDPNEFGNWSISPDLQVMIPTPQAADDVVDSAAQEGMKIEKVEEVQLCRLPRAIQFTCSLTPHT